MPTLDDVASAYGVDRLYVVAGQVTLDGQPYTQVFVRRTGGIVYHLVAMHPLRDEAIALAVRSAPKRAEVP